MDIEQDIRRACNEAIRLGHRPARTIDLLKRHGAVGAARRLLASGDPSETGIEQLSKLGRLDLTVEAVVLRNRQHFHEGEVVTALRRLELHGYCVERFAGKSPPKR